MARPCGRRNCLAFESHLGVHYLVDVIVGAVIGIVVLGALYKVTDHGTAPGRVLVFAVGIGMLGLIHGVTFDSVAAVGSAVGAWLAWRAVGDLMPAHPSNRPEVVAGLAVFGLAGASSRSCIPSNRRCWSRFSALLLPSAVLLVHRWLVIDSSSSRENSRLIRRFVIPSVHPE